MGGQSEIEFRLSLCPTGKVSMRVCIFETNGHKAFPSQHLTFGSSSTVIFDQVGKVSRGDDRVTSQVM